MCKGCPVLWVWLGDARWKLLPPSRQRGEWPGFQRTERGKNSLGDLQGEDWESALLRHEEPINSACKRMPEFMPRVQWSIQERWFNMILASFCTWTHGHRAQTSILPPHPPIYRPPAIRPVQLVLECWGACMWPRRVWSTIPTTNILCEKKDLDLKPVSSSYIDWKECVLSNSHSQDLNVVILTRLGHSSLRQTY